MLDDKKDFADMIKLRVLEWGGYPGSSERIILRTRALTRGKQEVSRREDGCEHRNRERLECVSNSGPGYVVRLLNL